MAGTGTVVGLAGCQDTSGGPTAGGTAGGSTAGGGGSGSTDGSGSTSGGGDSSEVLNFPASSGTVMDFHMNGAFGPPNHITHGSRFGRILFDPVVKFMGNTSTIIPVHASEYTKEGKDLSITLREQTWHNGDPYTVESIKLFYDIEFLLREHTGEERVSTSYIEDYTVRDDLTIDFTLTQDWNEAFVLNSMFDSQMYPFHPAVWTEWRDRLQEAGPGTDEFEQVMSDLTTFTDVRVDGEEFVGYGPWQFDTRDSSSLILKKYPDHPNAGDINYGTIQYDAVSEPFAAWAEGQIDLMDTGFPLTEDQKPRAPPEDQYDLMRQDNTRLFLMAMNSDASGSGDRPTYEREIRHSIGFAINYENIASNLGSVWKAWQWPQTNLNPANMESDFFDVSGFTFHENNKQRAIELINQSDGYSYENGQVVDSNGEHASLNVMTGNFPERVTLAQTATDQLKRFGWNASVDVVDDPTYVERRSSGEFDIQIDPEGIESSLYMWEKPRITGWLHEQTHYPLQWDVPMPIGEPNLSPSDGDLETVDLAELTTQVETTDGLEAAHDVLYKLGWAWNQFLPMLAVPFRPFGGAVHSPPFDITTDDRTLRQAPAAHWHLIRTGLLKAMSSNS